MDDATFHAQTCSACQRGKKCRTAEQISKRPTWPRSTKPLLTRDEQGPEPSTTTRKDTQ